MSRPVVVDTNVVVAGLLTNRPESPTARLLTAMLEGDLYYLLSIELLREYRDVLLRPRIRERHHLSEDEIDIFLTRLAEHGAFRQTGETAPPPDPGDAHLWALLATTKQAILVTGDKLLVDNPPEKQQVVLPDMYWRLKKDGGA